MSFCQKPNETHHWHVSTGYNKRGKSFRLTPLDLIKYRFLFRTAGHLHYPRLLVLLQEGMLLQAVQMERQVLQLELLAAEHYD